MLNTPFLTELDSRASVKGTRDPLGAQAIWSRFGRHVVGNLTTVSTSLRDFTTTIVGYYFAERVAEEGSPGSELATFLKWEQLAAYARIGVNGERGVRGNDRVRAALNDGGRLTLSPERSHQILGNQTIYGLWGLYTVPSRASGLLEGDPPRLTPPARDLVHNVYLPALNEFGSKDGRKLVRLLAQNSIKLEPEGADARLLKCVASVLRSELTAAEVPTYRFHLVDGGPDDRTQGRQRQTAELLCALPSAEAWSPAYVQALAKAAYERGEAWHPLAHRLERIRACEAILAPASRLFAWLLGLDGRPIDEICDKVRSAWGESMTSIDASASRDIAAELGAESLDHRDRWLGIGDSMATGRYDALLKLLIDQNRSVMATRGGAAWVDQQGGKLIVRFREENGSLPSRDELPTLWRHSYFLDSLRIHARRLAEVS